MRISFEKSDVNLGKLVIWLSEESYWAHGRSAEIIEKSLENSAASAQEILKDLPKFRLLLVTKDAHEIYRSVGFSELENPDRWMFLDKGF